MRCVLSIVAAVAALVFLSGPASAQQCANGRCAVAPAAAFAPSYGTYAAPVVAASPVFVQPLLFVVPGVPTTAVTAPPAAAPVQATPQYIPQAVQAAPVFAAPQVFAAPVVVQQQVHHRVAVAAAPVVVQQQVHAGGGLLGRAVVTQQRQPRVQVQTVRTVVRNR
jgi:hypothetical protein